MLVLPLQPVATLARVHPHLQELAATQPESTVKVIVQKQMRDASVEGELAYADKEVLTTKQTIEHINEGLFVAFAKIIDAGDPFVSGHADRVADYSAAIARELGLPPDRVEIIRQAGFMHDIGKIAIAEHVLHKPSKLTDEEYEYIKTHAALGGEFLETCPGLRHLAPFVRHHHEWWNGHGYPDGLCGE